MKRKFKIKFKKQSLEQKEDSWNEVTDSYLLSVLYSLQLDYDFKIMSVNFNNCREYSSVVIKCEKKYKELIFLAFIAKLGKYITNVSY